MTATNGHGSEVALSGAGDENQLEDTAATRRAKGLLARIDALVQAIREGDEAKVEAAVLNLSRRRRIFAPLGIVVGAFAMLFDGLKLLFSNWRLALVQLLPAMWIWVALLDLKLHVFHGKSFHRLEGGYLLAAIAGAGILTAASFFLNAAFAFAIARPGSPQIPAGFTNARRHAPFVLAAGALIGWLLGTAAFYIDRWGRGWFAVSMSIVIAIMMVTYVAVPSRLIGIKTSHSRSDRLKASMVGGAIGGAVCSPPYALGRLGLLMLGSHVLFIPGIFLLALGACLQVGATSAVKAIKMSSKLVAGYHVDT